MADNQNVIQAGTINQTSLAVAYDFILNELHANDLKATAAFVTCFAAEFDAVRNETDLIDQMALLNPAWFSGVLPMLKNGRLEGWTGANFYRSMAAAGHEMAWHGTTHLPLSIQTSSQAVALELELASRLFPSLKSAPKTIVFPRNQIGHLDQLRHYGFETYRAGLPVSMTNRLSGLLSEWNIFDARVMDLPCSYGDWHLSPAGNFLNWPSGVRAAVPISVTVRRWKSLLRRAADCGGYVHMWFHPHNLITAPAMQIAFQEIIRFAGDLVKSGDLASMTMSEANEHYKSGMSQ